MTGMLSTVYDYNQVDFEAKADDLARYKRFMWNASFGNGTCSGVLGASYRGFDAGDAAKVARWSGLPCT